MAQIEQRLFVFAHIDGLWVPSGRLSLLEEGPRLLASTFAYGLRYLTRRSKVEVDPLTLSLRDLAATRAKILFPPNDCALFGAIRDAAPESWGRRVIEAKLQVPADSLPESRYLVYAGDQRAGALAIRRNLSDAARAERSDWNDLENLADGAEKIEAGIAVPASLEAIYHLGTPLGGKRPKASVRDERGTLWVAKFSSHTDAVSVPAIEAATLALAADAGLRAPPVKLVDVGGRLVMLARRFDRYWAPPGGDDLPPGDLSVIDPAPGLVEQRLPFISAQTLMGSREGGPTGVTYGHIAQSIRRYGHPGRIRADNRELFARMVFNMFVSNDDDHLRNHGLLWDPRLPGWTLSPLYDVMPRASLAAQRMLALGVGSEGRAASLDNAFGARDHFTLTAGDAAALISNIWNTVRHWRGFCEEFGVPAEQLEQIAPAFRHIDEIASKDLRRQLP